MRPRPQVSTNSSQSRTVKIHRDGESPSETENRLATLAKESYSERSERLRNQRERQQTYTARVRNRVLAHSNRSAFRYNPQTDYAQQNMIIFNMI
ncbi:Uncharacterized protein FWK35_00030072 [Aphis craccivora]|uniref:Uncharacterized protein n=1 Tax=Aphis craccivora TaxID=307492 RepID=A0A6G0YHY4_APHCR|nr:Uncharacterized protein FWK35_00030072 [Aphis craccivora]